MAYNMEYDNSDYPRLFAARLNDQTIDTRRVLRQTRNRQTVVTRHHLAWVLPRKLRLRLQPTNHSKSYLTFDVATLSPGGMRPFR